MWFLYSVWTVWGWIDVWLLWWLHLCPSPNNLVFILSPTPSSSYQRVLLHPSIIHSPTSCFSDFIMLPSYCSPNWIAHQQQYRLRDVFKGKQSLYGQNALFNYPSTSFGCYDHPFSHSKLEMNYRHHIIFGVLFIHFSIRSHLDPI